MHKSSQGFTLTELLVSIGILVVLVLLVSRLFTSAAAVTSSGNKHIDCDLQARQVFDRMAVDFAQMIKRPDVDCYVKGLDPETGNDRIAFFSHVPGYSSGSPSPISLVAYRINSNSSARSFNNMERMGKGLPWNGAASTDKPLIFGPTPTLINNWPSATTGDSSNPSYQDPDYERIGPQIFRFEYSYFLKNGTLAVDPGAPGLQDVAAISVCIAAVDPKSKALLDNSKQVAPPNDNITKLAGKLRDYTSGMQPGQLLGSWQDVLDNNKNPDSDIAAMPRPAISAIRIYERYFHLLPKP